MNETIKWHAMPVAEAAQNLASNQASGLSAAEVQERQKKYGRNEMTAKAGVSAWLKFLRQFNQAVVYILLAATMGCFLLAEFVDQEPEHGKPSRPGGRGADKGRTGVL